MLLTNKDLHRIEHYKKISVENSMHLAVHLNSEYYCLTCINVFKRIWILNTLF